MTVDGITADCVVRPRTVEELSEIVRASKGSIVPVGAGTQLEFGNPLRSAQTVIDLHGLNRVTAYNPADLTVHLEAGVTLGELQSRLAENNQMLPLDPWNGPSATIGGVVAANAQGPLRATGTIRNWIIGMRVVHADGRVSKTGGRVVKNVTGYDLAKLYTGSLGTLAIIAEVSLKLRSSFGKTATAVADFDDASAALEAVSTVRNTGLQPICCEFAGPRPTVWLRFGEHERAVEWQLASLPKANWQIVEGNDERMQWESFRERYRQMGPIVGRVIGSPSNLREIIGDFRPQAWIAHCLNGIVLMQLSDSDQIRRIRERLPLVIEKADRETRRQTPTFGVHGAELRLMKEMKHALDPDGRLNPGRHVDGE